MGFPKIFQKKEKEKPTPKDDELPYPYPRNEHEDMMNWVSVNPVMSGRS